MKLNIADIEKIAESNHVTEEIKFIVNTFLRAINDWPNQIENLDDYEFEVHDFIKGETQKKNIVKTLNNIDLNKYAWQAESLTQLLEVYNYFDKDLSLKEIIEKLKK
jgi:hypothetical protein